MQGISSHGRAARHSATCNMQNGQRCRWRCELAAFHPLPAPPTMTRSMPARPATTRPPSRAAAVAFVAFCALLLAVWVGLDVIAAGAGPFWWKAILLLVLALPAILGAASVRRRWAKPTLLGVLGLSALITLVPWFPRKRFVFTLQRVQPGMTVEQVDALMAGYLRGAGAKWQVDGAAANPERLTADGSGTLVYRWNDHDGDYDSDWGVVTIAAGRVSKVEFMPD